MHETILHTNWDDLFLGVPCLLLLFCGFFRLDQVFASKGRDSSLARRTFSGLDESGEPMICDPDGRAVR